MPKELFPLSPAKLDIYAYRTVYDVYWNKPLYMTKSPLDVIRTALLHLRFDEHAWEHRKHVLKKIKNVDFISLHITKEMILNYNSVKKK